MDHGAFLLCFYRERWFRAYYDLSGLSEGNTCYLNICRLQLFSKSNEATKCLSSGPCSSKIQTDPCYAVSPVARKVHYVEHTKESASSTRPCTTGSGCRGYISIFQAGSTFFATFDFFPNEPKSGKDNHMVCWLLAAGITKKNTAEGMKWTTPLAESSTKTKIIWTHGTKYRTKPQIPRGKGLWELQNWTVVIKAAFTWPRTESPPWAWYKTSLNVAFTHPQHTSIPRKKRQNQKPSRPLSCFFRFPPQDDEKHINFRPQKRRLRHMRSVHFASHTKTTPFLLLSQSISRGCFRCTKIMTATPMVFWSFLKTRRTTAYDLRTFGERLGNTSVHVLSNLTAASTRSRKTCCSEKIIQELLLWTSPVLQWCSARRYLRHDINSLRPLPSRPYTT